MTFVLSCVVDGSKPKYSDKKIFSVFRFNMLPLNTSYKNDEDVFDCYKRFFMKSTR